MMELDKKGKQAKEAMDILTVEDFDSVEFWVGNAYQAAYYYYNAFGFKPIGWSSLKTGNRDYSSYVLKQGDAKIVLSAPYSPSSEMASHQMIHGDGAKVIGLKVRDVETAWKESINRGARGIQPPTELKDDHGSLRVATIGTYGDVLHKFIERDNSSYTGPYLPSYEPLEYHIKRQDTGVKRIDHIVGNVEWHHMDKTVEFYHSVFGFEKFIEFSENDIATQYSALRSKVVRNYNNKIKMPINEPASGLKMSQIEEYISYYHGAGVQHIALSTDNIIETVKTMRDNGVEFIRVPKNYYENLSTRVGKIDEDMAQLSEHGILVDRDDKGYLLQLFSRPIQDRPTFFFEIIERHGSEGFGKGNFQALFESIEREQAERGNL